jgi:hypothetical protein
VKPASPDSSGIFSERRTCTACPLLCDDILITADGVEQACGHGRETILAALANDERPGAQPADASENGQLLDRETATARAASLLASARRVLITTAPSGVHMTVVIGALGLRGEVEGKLMRFDKSADINAWLAREGDADALGFGPTTEIVDVDGVTHGGLLPNEAQMVLPYAAAATAQAFGDPDVRTLLAALTSADARAAFEATGMTYAAPSPAA